MPTKAQNTGYIPNLSQILTWDMLGKGLGNWVNGWDIANFPEDYFEDNLME